MTTANRRMGEEIAGIVLAHLLIVGLIRILRGKQHG